MMQRINRAYIWWTIVATLFIEAVLAALFLFPKIQFDNKLGISLFATVPAFVVTIIQLVRTQQIQRAGYIKDFLTEFRKNNELYSAYYDLVYRYRDEVYERVKDAADDYLKSRGTPIRTEEKPVFAPFESIPGSKEPGTRLFYPTFFQFSPEEKKLDGLLDYFNTIGLYLYEGLIRIEDVVTVLGDYLAVLADRKIVQAYLDLCDDPKNWKYEASVGASTPYQHLRFLIEAYQEYNLAEYHRRKTAEIRAAIEEKREQIKKRKHV